MPIREARLAPSQTPKHATVSGETTPHAKVEIENASVRPDRGATAPVTLVADAFGKFEGHVPVGEGDYVRLRAQGQGGPSSWLTVRAQGVSASSSTTAATDAKNARVDAFAVAITPRADGTLAIDGRDGAPLSEPFAKLRFTNPQTGFFVDVTLDEEGRVPNGPLVLNGAAGHSIDVSISDGAHDTAHEMTVLSVVVHDGKPQAVMPGPLARDGRPSTTRFTGPLFVDGAKPTDVQQGSIGNCYVPAAMAAMAQACPDAIASMFRDNGDGTYTVRLYDTSWVPVPKQVLVTVDGELYARGSSPMYGKSIGTSGAEQMELWFPLFEKAYAVFRGGYDVVGQGGAGGKVMSHVLGSYDDYTDVPSSTADVVWQKLFGAVSAGHPTTAGTHGQGESHRYMNSGLYANHAYSVLGAREEGGQRFVTLRNPWGSSEAGNDGKNDGIFELPFEKFMHLFVNVASVPVE